MEPTLKMLLHVDVQLYKIWYFFFSLSLSLSGYVNILF